MAKSPNVYDKTYVNSGPGVGLSSNSNSIRNSNVGYRTEEKGSSVYNRNPIDVPIASNIAKQLSVGISTSPAFEYARENLRNPASSALSANAYNNFDNMYGIGYDMDDYYDKLMNLTKYNNDWSANQAKNMMDYQTNSDRYAMAWSAQEAAKSRDWTESLSNNAHQREVKDLLAAGLNPILSANNGAYVGSGATGQSFTSNGAMASPDTAASAAMGSVLSQCMTTARDIMVTKISADQQKYNADMSYASTKLATEASIYNNNNLISANKAINRLNRDADIERAAISAGATRDAAAASAGAMISAANINKAASDYRANIEKDVQYYKAGLEWDSRRYEFDNNLLKNPYKFGKNLGEEVISDFGDTFNSVVNSVGRSIDNYLKDHNPSYHGKHF